MFVVQVIAADDVAMEVTVLREMTGGRMTIGAAAVVKLLHDCEELFDASVAWIQ